MKLLADLLKRRPFIVIVDLNITRNHGGCIYETDYSSECPLPTFVSKVVGVLSVYTQRHGPFYHENDVNVFLGG